MIEILTLLLFNQSDSIFGKSSKFLTPSRFLFPR